MLADSYISEFLNSRIFSKEMSKIGEKLETNAVFRNGDTFEETINRMIDIERKTVKRMSKARLSGVYTVERKLLKLPSGQEVAVVVRVWTYGSMRGAEKLKYPEKFRSRNRRRTYKHKNFISHGKEMTDINDF